ncbi:MAG: DUF3187 family protein [Thermodesulfovibrionia bacterium]|nr:DUF3187 family protein [Thermodesulfovibrionia bacterium]
MRYAGYSTFVFLILFIITPFSIAGSFDGPLQVKNQYPIFMHAGAPYIAAASMENSFSASLSHSSTYTVQSSKDWVIDQDMEVTELNLRYKKVLYDSVEIGVDIPIIALSGGFMDGFLDSYHKTLGLPDYGRGARPDDDFLYEIRRDGKLIVKGKTGVALGDIRLTAKKPLISSDEMKLSLMGDIELPTGSAKKGYGNGSIDAGVALLFNRKISDDFMAYLNLGSVFPGDLKGYEDIKLEDFIHGGVAVETTLKEKYSLILQLQGQSRIYPRTDLGAVDRGAWLLSFGGRYVAGRNLFELSFTEDINSSGAPDFILNLSYKARL